MNCANHPEVANVAYCRTCGKPLCANCARDVRGIIYCENCIADRLGSMPAATAGVSSSAPLHGAGAPLGESGPNPVLAGLLGAIPFGVGAVYNGQYIKGLVHLAIFVGLVWGENVATSEGVQTALGLGIAFFCIYQIIDAVRSAHAIRRGQPAPDPFGLADTFGTGERVDTSKVPVAALILIGLGALFLLQTSGLLGVGFDLIWPLMLIALGGWLFAKRMGWVEGDQCGGPRSLAGPLLVFTVGGLSLLENLHGPGWHRTWPVLLLAIGLGKLLEGQLPQSPSIASGQGTGSSNEVPPSSEVKNG